MYSISILQSTSENNSICIKSKKTHCIPVQSYLPENSSQIQADSIVFPGEDNLLGDVRSRGHDRVEIGMTHPWSRCWCLVEAYNQENKVMHSQWEEGKKTSSYLMLSSRITTESYSAMSDRNLTHCSQITGHHASIRSHCGPSEA